MGQAAIGIGLYITNNPVLSFFIIVWIIGALSLCLSSIRLLFWCIKREKARRYLKLNGISGILSEQSIRHSASDLLGSIIAIIIVIPAIVAPAPRNHVLKFSEAATSLGLVIFLLIWTVNVVLDQQTVIKTSIYTRNFSRDLVANGLDDLKKQYIEEGIL